MNPNSSSPASGQRLAIGLSISLHLLLLCVGYYVTLHRPASIGTGYTITLVAVDKQQKASDAQKGRTQAKKSAAKKRTQARKKPKMSTKPKPKNLKKTQKNTTGASRNPTKGSKQNESDLDERGLYKSQEGKQAGVKLDLAGWMWDQAPQPNDNTDESGKIIFEIKIDEFGEVIAVKTLEKTTSPLVEKIYKDALTALTFSRTADNIAYAPVYAGKVTFILRTK